MLFDDCKFIDLTHLITPNIPSWDGSCGFSIENQQDYDQGCRTQKINMKAGLGTHLDAPSHFFSGGPSIDDIPLQQLIIPACVLNVSEKADASYLISTKDIENYESQYGRIPENSFVIGYTGWSRFWPDNKSYGNPDKNGQKHFPSFSAEAAQLLIDREVAGIGIDTLSPDCDLNFPVHKLMLGQGKYIVENIANGHLMPAQGAYVILLPLNLDSTESPMRAIGVLTKT